MLSKAEVLSRIPLFGDLSGEEIAELAERTLERRYAPGDVLFREGDACAGFFVLAQGRVKIVKTSPAGREIMLAVESAPSSIAEIPMFDGGPYPATVTALDDVVAYLIRKEDFRKICLARPGVALKVLAVVGRRLRQLVSIVESVSFGSVRQRLAQTLLEVVRAEGRNPAPFPLTHQELASRLGTVREVVSRNLSRFQAQGLIRIEKRELWVRDEAGLIREAETEL
ncbi:MAG: Crp/Fnr family transcriptional regulator [Bryobacterales bacterium]|nr:Crp/Fnr family transcriptional regulator [Bryobacteraceae bacterium]MDW8355885.1 Crp/Fnr family transcriptional regulator [Bryobacterales bacterium]